MIKDQREIQRILRRIGMNRLPRGSRRAQTFESVRSSVYE